MRINELLEGILHGDDEHREWLTEAIYNWAAGKPIPEPRGSGTKDGLYKEIERLKQILEQNGITY
jgi:hypothetical protein